MAIGVTGTAAFASSTKQTAADPSTNLDAGTPRLHFVDGDNRHVALRMVSDGPGNAYPPPYGLPRVPMVAFTAGGQQGEVLLRLTQANCNDIITALANFANNGVLN